MKRCKYIIGIRRRIAADLTKADKEALVDWVSIGNSPLDNPWLMCYEDNRPLSFISAMQVFNDFASEAGTGIFDHETDNFNDSVETNMPF